jgi:hypothetical protein
MTVITAAIVNAKRREEGLLIFNLYTLHFTF